MADAPQDRTDSRSDRALRWLQAVSLAVPLLLFAAAAAYDRHVVEEEARTHVETVTDALSEHAERVLETADLVLARVLDRVRGMSWQEIHDSRDIYNFLLEIQRGLPQVESVFLVDGTGHVAASSRSFPMSDYDVREREYVRAGENGGHLFVSAPFRGQMAGTFAFTLSRARMTGGKLDGFVAVTAYSGHFQNFYRRVVESRGTATAALVRTDGSLLVRYPALAEQPLRLPPDSPLLRAAAADHGVYLGRSSLDDTVRLAAFRRLPGTQLLVNYNLTASEYLREWYVHLAIIGVLALLTGVVMFVATQQAIARGRQERASLRRLLDETARRQRAEAALQQSQRIEALGRLTGGVAHDFNNLLSAILGALELATRKVQDPGVRRLLTMASEAAQRGARLTGQMLAFARKQHVALVPVDVNEAISGMDELLRRSIGPRMRLRHDLAPGLWPVLADPVQLEVALLNLAINARDATDGAGELAIATRNTADGEVLIEVRDDGPGMPEHVRASAFEPFYTTKAPGKGTGLGLSMVHGFVTGLGGRAAIESAPGQGTAVRLFLPRCTAEAPAPAAAPEAPARPAAGLRVLLVDDDPGVRDLTAEMLRGQGHEVTAFASGAEAIERVRTGAAFDLLVVDYAMPGLTGVQVAEALHALDPGLPALLITGYADIEALKSWTDRGLKALSKPFRDADLAAAVAEAAHSQRQPAAAAT